MNQYTISPEERIARWEAIAKMREDGMTFAEIGKALGMSRQRVHQIFEKYKEISKNGKL